MTKDDDLKVTMTIRIPLGLRARLIIAAYGINKGSINAEIVRRLQESFTDEEKERIKQWRETKPT